MADPLTALGLASSILTLISFGTKLFSDTKTLYSSAKGASAQHLDLEETVRDLEKLCDSLKSIELSPRRNDIEVTGLREPCQAVAQELLETLKKIRVKDGNRTWHSLRAALKVTWSASHIKELEQRLDRYRDQITMGLVKLINDTQSEMYNELQNIAENQHKYHVQTSKDMGIMRQQLSQELEAAASSAYSGHDLDKLAHAVSSFEDHFRANAEQSSVLKSLDCGDIYARESNVARAHEQTFEWIFDDQGTEHHTPRHDFLNWLQRGSGIFFIAGKAGSGKSTLVKYISTHAITLHHLQEWAAGHELTTGSFYFWAAGAKWQKTQEGLFRSLLFDMFRKDSTLAEIMTPDFTHGRGLLPPWDLRRLFECFSCLTNVELRGRRFCFFIDGLDEFEGDQIELAEVLETVSEAAHIKLCVSSRPRNVFEDTFGRVPGQHLLLQRFTRRDIEHYVQKTLQRSARYHDFCGKQGQNSLLVESIVEKAQGVFLWVFLVVRSLLRGMRNSDSIWVLQRRLLEMPADLEDYFMLMLNPEDNVYKEESARMLLAILEAPERQLPIGVLNLLDGREERALDEEAIFQTISPLDSLETMRHRINARCADLVEIIPADIRDNEPQRESFLVFETRVSLIHRTVKDFLESKRVQKELTSRFEGHFDVLRSLAYACMLLARQVGAYDCGREVGSRLALADWIRHFAQKRELRDQVADMPLRNTYERHIFRPQAAHAEQCFFVHMAACGHPHYVSTYIRILAAEGGPDADLKVLLTRALFQTLMRPRRRRHWGMFFDSTSFVGDSKVVSQLLASGADPNATILREAPMSTCFKNYMKQALYAIAVPEQDFIFSSFRSLILSGADLDARVPYVTQSVGREKARLNEPQNAGLQDVLDLKVDKDYRAQLSRIIERQRTQNHGWRSWSSTFKLPWRWS